MIPRLADCRTGVAHSSTHAGENCTLRARVGGGGCESEGEGEEEEVEMHGGDVVGEIYRGGGVHSDRERGLI